MRRAARFATERLSLMNKTLNEAAGPAPAADDLEAVEKLRATCRAIKSELAKVIVGQEEVVDQVLISILTRSHALLVGVPGLAKTLLVKIEIKT